MYAEGGYYDRMTKRPVSVYTYNMKYDAYNLGAGAKYLLGNSSYLILDLTKNNYVSYYKISRSRQF